MELVVLGHAASTLFLCGLIWTVQVVHYPLFAGVGADRFARYQAEHSRRITGVLLVPWAVQGLTTLALLVAPPAGAPRWVVWAAAALAAAPVAVTLSLSIPAHQQLGRGFDAVVHRRLLATNWLRTAAWTLHAPVAFVLVHLTRG